MTYNSWLQANQIYLLKVIFYLNETLIQGIVAPVSI